MKDSIQNLESERDKEAFLRDIESISEYNGIPFGRLEMYWESESKHLQIMRSQNGEALMLFRAFQCHFLDVAELLNTMWTSTCSQIILPFYKRNFIPNLLSAFHQLCASELAATHGYPMPAYTILRNVFDQLILISAAMQGITDFYKIEGCQLKKQLTEKESKKLRKATEYSVRKKMIGNASDLTSSTIYDLEYYDKLFDYEVHGARLTHGLALNWIQGDGLLALHPEYESTAANLYTIRLCEVTWLLHRLLPLYQNSAMVFPQEWAKKWCALDKLYKESLQFQAKHQLKKVSAAFIELVKEKFPFSEISRYPLEGQEIRDA